MNKLNFKEIIQRLKNFFSNNIEFRAADFFGDDLGEIDKARLQVGKYEIVHEDDEIDGQSCYKVFYFSDHDVYIEFEGDYSSYDGLGFYGFDSGHEVIPYYFIGTQYKVK